MAIDLILVGITTLFYLTAAAMTLRGVLNGAAPSTLAYVFSTLGCMSHLAFLMQVIFISAGQDMSMTNVLSLVAWLITVTMIVSARFLPNGILLPGVYAFAALSVILSGLLPAEYRVHIELEPGLVVHISLSLMAYGCLSIAFLYAIQMYFISNKLKQKGASLLHSPLPPLVLVESILFKLTTVGTVLLFISLASGFIFIDSMFSVQYAHKTVLSLVALGIYLLLLIGQHKWGWRNRQVVGLTTIGVTLLSLAYFGSRFVREILL